LPSRQGIAGALQKFVSYVWRGPECQKVMFLMG